MKKILFIFSLLILLSCDKKADEPDGCCCMTISTEFFIEVEGTKSKDFLNSEGNFDQENVYFYKIENGKERKIEIEKGFSKNETIFLSEFDRREFLTGKLETIYLKTKTTTDIIKIKAEIVKGKCSIYIKFDEVYVNEQKINIQNGRITIKLTENTSDK